MTKKDMVDTQSASSLTQIVGSKFFNNGFSPNTLYIS